MITYIVINISGNQRNRHDIFEIVIFMLFFVNRQRVNTFGGKTAVIGDEGTMLQRQSKT